MCRPSARRRGARPRVRTTARAVSAGYDAHRDDLLAHGAARTLVARPSASRRKELAASDGHEPAPTCLRAQRCARRRLARTARALTGRLGTGRPRRHAHSGALDGAASTSAQKACCHGLLGRASHSSSSSGSSSAPREGRPGSSNVSVIVTTFSDIVRSFSVVSRVLRSAGADAFAKDSLPAAAVVAGDPPLVLQQTRTLDVGEERFSACRLADHLQSCKHHHAARNANVRGLARSAPGPVAACGYCTLPRAERRRSPRRLPTSPPRHARARRASATSAVPGGVL